MNSIGLFRQLTHNIYLTDGNAGLDKILMVDAVYSCVGLAAGELFDFMDFEDYFIQHFRPVVQNYQNNPNGKIVHRLGVSSSPWFLISTGENCFSSSLAFFLVDALKL